MINRDIEILFVDDGMENYIVICFNYLIGELLGRGIFCYIKVIFFCDGVLEIYKLLIG